VQTASFPAVPHGVLMLSLEEIPNKASTSH
jgi:hypothetical protein